MRLERTKRRGLRRIGDSDPLSVSVDEVDADGSHEGLARRYLQVDSTFVLHDLGPQLELPSVQKRIKRQGI